MGGNKNDKNYELKNTYDIYFVVGGALSNTSLTKTLQINSRADSAFLLTNS